ncbi:hypothetical protein AB0K51_06140 [Kitasatospora sp. NPDC049285]|uniref:hypothetical protein n=1 Tax=Kitasatospora sp. NPDC049285 TaxID=3157096 RepID=UPI003446BF41
MDTITGTAARTAAADGPAQREPSGGAERPGRRGLWAFALLAGYLAQAAFRWVLSRGHTFPVIHADEASYLAIARVLAGHPTTEMPVGVVIPGGYPLLLVPAYRLGHDAESIFRLVMATNALVSALVFPLAYLALRRLALSRPAALLIGTAAAALGPVVFYAEYAMSETVFTVILLAWAITMHGWLSAGTVRRRSWYAAGTGALAAYAMATHDRGGVVVALTCLVLVAALVRRWAPRRASWTGLAVLAVGGVLDKLFAIWVQAQFKDSPASSVGTQVVKNLIDTHLLLRTLKRVVGQWWYFTTSSYGLAAVAVVLCLVAVFSRRFAVADRVVSFCLLALVAGVALASSAGLGNDARVDNWVYARYLAPLVPVFFVIGAAALVRLTRRQVLWLWAGGSLFMVATGGVVVRLVGPALHKVDIIPWTMPDALFLAHNWTELHLWRTTAGALLVLAGCVLVRLLAGRRSGWLLGVLLTGFAVLATSVMSTHITNRYYTGYKKAIAVGFAQDAELRPGDNLVMEWDVDWGLRMAQSYLVYPGRVWTVSLRYGTPPPAAANVAVVPLPKDAPDADPATSWPKAPSGWHVVKVNKHPDREYGGGYVIWRR